MRQGKLDARIREDMSMRCREGIATCPRCRWTRPRTHAGYTPVPAPRPGETIVSPAIGKRVAAGQMVSDA